MRKLLIIGAGNVGGFLAYNLNLFREPYELIGFLDDNPQKIGQTVFGVEVIGNSQKIRDFDPSDIAVAVGIAYPAIRKKIYDSLGLAAYDCPSFVSKNAWISNQVSIGKGSIIYPGVSVNHESEIGDFVIMNMNCAIGHNCIISSFSTLAPGVNFAGFTYVEEAVDIGIGVATRQRARIGQGAVIGGQSMIVGDIPPYAKAYGVPARVRGSIHAS
jgi:sugar O-acyltransferase (sialic acid O-acetyltransferase NeuD family)